MLPETVYTYLGSSDLLRLVYDFFTEVYLQEQLQDCRTMYLKVRHEFAKFQERQICLEEELIFRIRQVIRGPQIYGNEIHELVNAFREISGHLQINYRRILVKYDLSMKMLRYLVNDMDLWICEDLWGKLARQNSKADTRRTIVAEELKVAQNLFRKELKMIERGDQLLPRTIHLKHKLFKYILVYLDRHTHTIQFWFQWSLLSASSRLVSIRKTIDHNRQQVDDFLARAPF